MNGLAALPFLIMLPYCLVQTVRDWRRRRWWMAGWGIAMIIFIGWIVERLTSGPQY